VPTIRRTLLTAYADRRGPCVLRRIAAEITNPCKNSYFLSVDSKNRLFTGKTRRQITPESNKP
jgi:hypothetical protein